MSVSHTPPGRWPDRPLVSCACVTEGRAAFMPWLVWCFDRQTWPHRELLIVDSSERPFGLSSRDDVRVVALPPGTGIARKRNVAVQAARGDLITWFDDDDWQHPHKLAWHVEALRDEAAYSGSASGWFVDLRQSRCAAFRAPHGCTIFNSAAFRREAVLPVAFREGVPRASDTYWMRQVAARCRRGVGSDRDDLFFWLSHEGNISNPARKKVFSHHLDVLRDHIGTVAWGETDAALESLRCRLDAARCDRRPQASLP
jgi:glycosyltransferase involved in cell wall biosynthesis